MSLRFKRLVLFFFLPLFLYFSIYTWNWKTGYLDRLAALTGLEVTGWILAPGRWLQSNVDEFWSRYVYLVGVRQDNEDLVLRVRELEQELARISEKAKSADRLIRWSAGSKAQAEIFSRPLRRRLARTARPARVLIRLRKPCTLARRRLFGWKVRLTTVVLPR